MCTIRIMCKTCTIPYHELLLCGILCDVLTGSHQKFTPLQRRNPSLANRNHHGTKQESLSEQERLKCMGITLP